MILDLLLRLFHIVPAIFLAGGVFFMWCALLPALNGLADDTRKTVLDAVRGRWAKVVMATSGFLLATGLINLVRNATRFEYEGGPLYHILGAFKLMLALGIMFITARLSGRSAGRRKVSREAWAMDERDDRLAFDFDLDGEHDAIARESPQSHLGPSSTDKSYADGCGTDARLNRISDVRVWLETGRTHV